MLRPVRLALQRWLEQRREVRAHRALVWPARDGSYHAVGYQAQLAKARKHAKITRRFRFHDLRHTCASHLLQGTWAPELMERPLRLEEVRDWLGHVDISVTQRYAHLCADGIRAVVRDDGRGGGGGGGSIAAATSDSAYELPTEVALPTGFEPVTYGLGRRRPGHCPAANEPVPADVASAVANLRRARVRYEEAVADGDRHKDFRGLELARAAEAFEEVLVAAASEDARAGSGEE